MYIALRAMQVQGVDGNTRQVKPGEEIPEAEEWKTREAYVKRGWICLEGQPINDAATARMVRAIRDRDKDIRDRENSLRDASEFIEKQNQEIRDRGDRISQLSSELEEEKLKNPVPLSPVAPAVETSDSAPSVDTAPSDTLPENEGGGGLAFHDHEATPASDENPKLTKSELQRMNKDGLMLLADDMGLNPGQSKNKLVEAIFAAQ